MKKIANLLLILALLVSLNGCVQVSKNEKEVETDIGSEATETVGDTDANSEAVGDTDTDSEAAESVEVSKPAEESVEIDADAVEAAMAALNDIAATGDQMVTVTSYSVGKDEISFEIWNDDRLTVCLNNSESADVSAVKLLIVGIDAFGNYIKCVHNPNLLDRNTIELPYMLADIPESIPANSVKTFSYGINADQCVEFCFIVESYELNGQTVTNAAVANWKAYIEVH